VVPPGGLALRGLTLRRPQASYGGAVQAPPWLDELDLRADGPPWLGMGLRRTDEDGWLWPDDQRPAQLEERRRLLAERRDEVVHIGPGTEAAGAEVLSLVRAWLAAHDLAPELEPGSGATSEPTDAAGEPDLVTAARLVQEDLCLMVPRATPDGSVRHHLDAAVLCFPSHWRLADKAGRPADVIHGPVPGYRADLAERVDRYLERLRPGVIGVRRNWSVHDSPDLFAPDPPPSPRGVDVDEVATGLWLRSERQTLRALDAGGVLFTIRVQQVPFGALTARPDVAAALAARIDDQPAVLTAMNGLAPHAEAVLTWLRTVPV
jgi:dimethylamine monooxygenase subunit A